MLRQGAGAWQADASVRGGGAERSHGLAGNVAFLKKKRVVFGKTRIFDWVTNWTDCDPPPFFRISFFFPPFFLFRPAHDEPVYVYSTVSAPKSLFPKDQPVHVTS